MATAVQSYSHLLRRQIEESLAGRVHARLTLAPRLVRDGFETGYETLDAVLRGGLPISGTTEIVGSRSSGRATIAAAYLAERTREGHICAWVDTAGEMSPEAAMANGMDLERVLWVRCSGASGSEGKGREQSANYVEDAQRTQSKPDLRVVGGVSYVRDKGVGTPGAVNRTLGEVREVQVASDRQPKRRGDVVLQSRAAILPSRYASGSPQWPKPGLIGSGCGNAEALPTPRHELDRAVRPGGVGMANGFAKAKRPWGRLEQAVKAVDLLVQAGGFGAIVLDMGGIGVEIARKIPLATWFRWRAALERTRTSLVVLSPFALTSSQLGCAGSSAELVLRVEAALPEEGTVMGGVPYRLEVIRRRFDEASARAKKTVGKASAWDSRATWVAS